jgi:hypothetical protein
MNKPSQLRCLLGLFFCLSMLNLPVTGQNHKTKTTAVTDSMTVIKIFATTQADSITRVLFEPSQRIYKLPTKAKAIYLKRLKESLSMHRPVPIKRSSERSDIILSVGKVKKK